MIWSSGQEELVRKAAPEDLGEFGIVFDSARLEPKRVWTLPSAGSDEILALNMDDELRAEYHNFVMESGHECALQLFGCPDPIQNEMEITCELLSNGIEDMQDLPDQQVWELKETKRDWQLLLQVSSVDGTNVDWVGGGKLYYWMRRQDLRERDFETAWMILQFG